MHRSIWNSLASAAFLNAGRLVAILLLAKLTTPDVLGAYTYALAIVTPLVLLLGFEVRAAIVSDVAQVSTFGAYAALRRVGLSIAAALIGMLAAFEASHRGSVWPGLIVAGVGVWRIAWSMSELAWGAFQRRERLDLVAIGAALRGAAQVLTFAIPILVYAALVQRGSLSADSYFAAAAWGTWCCAAAWALLHVSFERRLIAHDGGLDRTWDWASVRRLALQTLPLGLVQLLIAASESVPRVWIAETKGGGLEELGYFGAIASLALAANIALIAVGTAASNRLAIYHHTDRRAFLRLAGQLLLLALAGGAVVMLLSWITGRWLLTALYRPEYAAYFPAFMLVMGAQCVSFLASMLGFAVTSMRLFWLQAPIHVAVLAGTVVASAWLIPGTDPVMAAAWVAVVRSCVHAVLYATCALYGILRQRAG